MLEEARIRYCQWDYAEGSLEYDISYLHPNWDLVIQTYEVRSVTHDGKLVYASDFALYRTGSIIPADFSAYPKLYKQRLWEVIFAIEHKFFEEARPDAVEHFIKAPYSGASLLGAGGAAGRPARAGAPRFYGTLAPGQGGAGYYQGHVDLQKLNGGTLRPGADYYVCDPVPCIGQQVQNLAARGVPRTAIHFEEFSPATLRV